MADLKSPAVSLATPDTRLRVEFSWQRDRFVHKVFLDEVESGISLEGEPDDPWPPSPPVQQLSREEIDGRAVILGVGAAGRSHWSLSVEADDQPDGRGIKFDWACRRTDPPEFLGSTYRLTESLNLSPLDPHCAVDRQRIDQDGKQILAIRASACETQTCRWSYRLETSLEKSL